MRIESDHAATKDRGGARAVRPALPGPRLLLGLATVYPAMWVAALYALAWRTEALVGHWPTYGRPDPKDTGFDVHYGLVVGGMLAVPAVGLLGSGLGVAWKTVRRDIGWCWAVAPGLAAVATIVGLRWLDPALLDWLLD